MSDSALSPARSVPTSRGITSGDITAGRNAAVVIAVWT
jgi:hypothetical protein